MYSPGDKSAAICYVCEKKVTTTFVYRSIDLKVPDVVVPDVLVAACDECGSIAGLPIRSIERINEAREKGRL